MGLFGGSLGGIVQSFLKFNPQTALQYAGGNWLAKQFARGRHQENADSLKAQEMMATTQEMGQKELKKYRRGTLTKGQKDTIKEQTDVQKAQLRQALASGGIADSSMRTTEEGNIKEYGAQLKNKFSEQHWDAAMKLLGLSSSAMNTLHQMNREHMQENIQLYSGLMNLIGHGTGAFMGGGGESAAPAGDGYAATGPEITMAE